MPNYCYEDENGCIHERFYSIEESVPQIIKLGNGSVAKRSYRAESVGVPAKKGWPMECVASGVNACQADDLRKHFKEIGVPTDVTSDGNPVYRDANHRKKALKSRGFVDKLAYC